MMKNYGFSEKNRISNDKEETSTEEFIRHEKKIDESEKKRPKPEDFGISPNSYDQINKMVENHVPKNKLPTPQLPEHRSKKNIIDDFESDHEDETHMLEESVSISLTFGLLEL